MSTMHNGCDVSTHAACYVRAFVFYRRLAARIGNAKAVTATARKIAILFYNAMRFGIDYKDPGVDHYEQQYRDRAIKQLHRRAAQFGLILQPQNPVMAECVS